MMELNSVLISKPHHCKVKRSLASYRGKGISSSAASLISTRSDLESLSGPASSCSSSSSSSLNLTSSATSSASSSSSSPPPPSCSSSLSNNVPSSDTIDETINDVVRSICADLTPSIQFKTTKVLKKKSLTVKSPSVTKPSPLFSKTKNGDAIDETIESVIAIEESVRCEDARREKDGKCARNMNFLYEEDIIDGFALRSFFTYSDLKRNEMVQDGKDIFDFDDQKKNDMIQDGKDIFDFDDQKSPATSSESSTSSSVAVTKSSALCSSSLTAATATLSGSSSGSHNDDTMSPNSADHPNTGLVEPTSLISTMASCSASIMATTEICTNRNSPPDVKSSCDQLKTTDPKIESVSCPFITTTTATLCSSGTTLSDNNSGSPVDVVPSEPVSHISSAVSCSEVTSESCLDVAPPSSTVTSSPSSFISESILQNQDLLRRELDTRFLASQDRNISVPPPPYMTRPGSGKLDPSSHQTPPLSHSSMPNTPPHVLDKLSRVDPPFYGPGYPILTTGATPQHSSGSASSSLSSPSEAYPSNGTGTSGNDSTLFGPPGHLAAFQPKSASISITADKCKSNTKSGRWCAMHVRIAWEIYHHQQKAGPSLHQPGVETNSSSSSHTQQLHHHSSHFKPSATPGPVVHGTIPTSSPPGIKSIPQSVANSGSERPSSDAILKSLNHNSLAHPFSSRSAELPFTSSLLSAAAGHVNNSTAIRPLPSGFSGHAVDPFGPLTPLNPYSRSPFGPFGNPFLAGLGPSVLGHQPPVGLIPPTGPSSSILNDSWMRSMAGTPRPGSSSLVGYPGVPPPSISVMPPTSSSSSSAAGSAWGGLRAEADRSEMRGSGISGYMSPHHNLSSSEKKKDDSKSGKNHSKQSKPHEGSHHAASFDGSSSKHHEKRAHSDRNGDHYCPKNWDTNKSNKRERSPSTHAHSYSSKYPKLGGTNHDSSFNPHSHFNFHLSMMSNMTGSSAYGISHGSNSNEQTKSINHHNDCGNQLKGQLSHRSEEELRKSSSSGDRTKSLTSTSNLSGDILSASYADKKNSSLSMTPAYREALEIELSKNSLLGFPPPSSPYSSSSALAAMSMASPLERSRFMGMFGLSGPGSSPFMPHSSVLSSGYPGIDPMKSFWGSASATGSPFFPPLLPGMPGLHSHPDPFKSLHEFPSRMPEFLEREHILARYNILNSHGGGAPLTDKLKDNSTSATSSSSSIPGPASCTTSSSLSGQPLHPSATSSASSSSLPSSLIMDHKHGPLGLASLPPPPVSMLPPLPSTSSLLRPPLLPPPILPPPPPSLLPPLPGSSSSSVPTLPTL